MIRLFEQHNIRKTKELDGMWDFCPEGENNLYKMPVPGCWEQNPNFDKQIEWIKNSGGDGKPIIISEFGAGTIYGYRDRSRCKWSEERQADVIEECPHLNTDIL